MAAHSVQEAQQALEDRTERDAGYLVVAWCKVISSKKTNASSPQGPGCLTVCVLLCRCAQPCLVWVLCILCPSSRFTVAVMLSGLAAHRPLLRACCVETAGMPVSEQNCHPFQWGRYLFMHNGEGLLSSVCQRFMRQCVAVLALSCCRWLLTASCKRSTLMWASLPNEPRA